MKCTWEKEKRLLKRVEFTNCYDNAVKIYSSNFVAFVDRNSERAKTKVGFAVTKKMGNAVMRNRLKRLLREFCRLHYENLPMHSAIVITPKKHLQIAHLGYESLEKELITLFSKVKECR